MRHPHEEPCIDFGSDSAFPGISGRRPGSSTLRGGWSSGGQLVFYDTFEYDQQNHKIRTDYFNANGSRRGIELFAYDSHGYLSEIKRRDGLPRRDSFRNDLQGKPVEWSSYDKDGQRLLKATWSYSDDSRGNPTEFLRYDRDDKVLSKEVYTYEFDSRGNWIKSMTTREVFGGQTLIEMTYRTIIYREPE